MQRERACGEFVTSAQRYSIEVTGSQMPDNAEKTVYAEMKLEDV